MYKMQQIMSDMQIEAINIIMQDVESQVVFVNWALSAASAHCATTGCRPKREVVKFLEIQKTPEIHNTAFLWNKPTPTRSYCLMYFFIINSVI